MDNQVHLNQSPKVKLKPSNATKLSLVNSNRRHYKFRKVFANDDDVYTDDL